MMAGWTRKSGLADHRGGRRSVCRSEALESVRDMIAQLIHTRSAEMGRL